MKRSDVVNLIAGWGSKEILGDIYYNNYVEWADNLLYTLEEEYRVIRPPQELRVMATGKIFDKEKDFGKDVFYSNKWDEETT